MVSQATIENCWVKSRVLSAKYGPRNRNEPIDLGWKDLVLQDEAEQRGVTREIEQNIRDQARQNRITQAMSIDQFLNPLDENIDDMAEVVVDEIAKAYSIGERLYETDEEDVIIPKVGHGEALQALQLLRLYEEQQEGGDSGWILRLNRHERVMKGRGFQGLKQASIKNFFQ